MDATGRWSLFLLVLSFYCASVLSSRKFESYELPQDGLWQPVSYTMHKLYVYSAFVIGRDLTSVRVIAITNTNPPYEPVFCRMWLSDHRVLTLQAKVQIPTMRTDKQYSATFVLCQLPEIGVAPQETHGATLAVIASIAANKPPTNLLNVTYSVSAPGFDGYPPLHVCASPLHSSYDRVDWMIEWIEMNRMLGVSHFYLYNGSVSDQMSCVLSHYQRQGLITLLPWNPPIIDNLIDWRGEVAALNDCLYRSIATAGWLLIIDTNEVLMPRRDPKITTVLHHINNNHNWPIKVTSIQFNSISFFLELEDDPQSPAPLIMSRKTLQLPTPRRLVPWSNRTLIRTTTLEIMENLTDKEQISLYSALLHNYQKIFMSPKWNLSRLHREPTLDRTAHRWAKGLWMRVKPKLQNIQCLESDNLQLNRSDAEPSLQNVSTLDKTTYYPIIETDESDPRNMRYLPVDFLRKSLVSGLSEFFRGRRV